jgi:hypothetical protein
LTKAHRTNRLAAPDVGLGLRIGRRFRRQHLWGGEDLPESSRVLGFDGSSSGMIRIISVSAAFLSRLASIGLRSVNSS